MLESGVLLGIDNKPFYWHLPKDRSGGCLPNSKPLWDIIWENKETITGFAHTHPGKGYPAPSYEDKTTFIAIENALGKHLNWYILSSDSQILCLLDNVDGYFGGQVNLYIVNADEITSPIYLDWMQKLREFSNY